MAPQRKIFQPTRFFTWVACGTLLGCLVGLAIRVSQPKHFESTAVVAGGFQETGETRLSLTHAHLISRNLGGSLAIDPKKIHEGTFIRAVDGKVSITTRSTDRYDAREIAREAARLFRSIEHEQDLMLDPVQILRFTDADRETAEDGSRLRNLLTTQASAAGIEDFLAVPGLAKEGNAKALALLADEDFSRRFNRYQEISVSLGLEGVPGHPITPHPQLLEEPQLAKAPADEPFLPAVWYAIAGGAIAGIAGGLLFGHAPVKKPVVSAPPQASPQPPRVPDSHLPKPAGPQDW